MMWPCPSACLTNECIASVWNAWARLALAADKFASCRILLRRCCLCRRYVCLGAGECLAQACWPRTWSHTSVRNTAIALGILLWSVHSAQAGSAASVSTAAELKAAIDSGIAHVEITQHLDLRPLPVFIDDSHAASDPLYTPRALFVNITALESISVRIVS